jgi:hypothetical protein
MTGESRTKQTKIVHAFTSDVFMWYKVKVNFSLRLSKQYAMKTYGGVEV